MLLVVLLVLPAAIVRPFHRWQHKWPARLLGSTLCFTGSRVEVTYDARHQRERRSVFVQNHVSMLDGHLALGTIAHPFCGVENAAHFRIPAYGWLMALGGGIRVPKRPGGRLNGIIAQARQRLQERNLSILVLPEGGRTTDGRLKPFHRGGFFLARELGLPVVPLAVRGMFHVLRRGSLCVRPGLIEIYVGPQIETGGMTDADIEQLTRKVRVAIAAWVARKEPVPADLSAWLRRPLSGAEEPLAPPPAMAIEAALG